jgi:hypothetical protein
LADSETRANANGNVDMNPPVKLTNWWGRPEKANQYKKVKVFANQCIKYEK